jgi:hypothetical protein
MIELQRHTRTTSPSRLHEILMRYECSSIVDPFMGLPTHLNYLKRHDVAVHGGDLVEWFVRVGEGIVVNDMTILRDSEVAEIVELLPGRIYPLDLFRAWEGVFFTEEQCVYLGVWHDNVHNLRSDGQTGLAILGLWRTLCYWLHKTERPDDMQDVPPSELAWSYIRQTEALVTASMRRSTVRQSDVLATLGAQKADALFLFPPARNSFRNADARIWMWEAWWQGDPYLSLEHAYRNSLFGVEAGDPGGYARAISAVLSAANDYRVLIVQTSEERLGEVEGLVREVRPKVELLAPHPREIYLVATK